MAERNALPCGRFKENAVGTSELGTFPALEPLVLSHASTIDGVNGEDNYKTCHFIAVVIYRTCLFLPEIYPFYKSIRR